MTKANTSIELLQMIDPFGGLSSCWNYVGKRWHKDGYGYPKRNQKPILAHRWSYEHHHGIHLTPDVVIRHTCDNPACCNPLHLLPGTQADNHKDMHERQRWKPGKHPMALHQETIEKIIQLKKTGLSYAKVAAIVGCSTPIVRKYWFRHLDDSLL